MRLNFKRSKAREQKPEPNPSRYMRRARVPDLSVRQQRLASLCVEIARDNPPTTGESAKHYTRRIRYLAYAVQHEQRARKRKAARAARRQNRHG